MLETNCHVCHSGPLWNLPCISSSICWHSLPPNQAQCNYLNLNFFQDHHIQLCLSDITDPGQLDWIWPRVFMVSEPLYMSLYRIPFPWHFLCSFSKGNYNFRGWKMAAHAMSTSKKFRNFILKKNPDFYPLLKDECSDLQSPKAPVGCPFQTGHVLPSSLRTHPFLANPPTHISWVALLGYTTRAHLPAEHPCFPEGTIYLSPWSYLSGRCHVAQSPHPRTCCVWVDHGH